MSGSSKTWNRVIRFVLTAALLVEVWCNAHWSVALTLTLLAISNEINAWVMGELGAGVREWLRVNRKDL